jgi:hypothetical protein
MQAIEKAELLRCALSNPAAFREKEVKGRQTIVLEATTARVNSQTDMRRSLTL